MSGAAWLALIVSLSACVGTAPPPPQVPNLRTGLAPVLPDTSGWGVHVLALRRAPTGAVWVGTYGAGMYLLPIRKDQWEHIPASTTSSGLGSAFINSIAVERDSTTLWYGSVGDGFGRSTDNGQTWRNWTAAQLGGEWHYVVPDGIVTRRDTVYIATTDGLRVTADGGATWRCVQAAAVGGAPTQRDDGCTERIRSLPSDYLLALDVGFDGRVLVGHLRGLSVSRDGGRSWQDVTAAGIAGERIRAIRVAPDSTVWAASETRIFVDSARTNAFKEALIRVPGYPTLPGAPRTIIGSPGLLPPAIGTSYGLVARTTEGEYRVFYVSAADRYRPAGDIWAATWFGPPWSVLGGSSSGLSRVLAGDLPASGITDTLPPAAGVAPRHVWFQRPVAAADGNPYVDASHLFASTLRGTMPAQPGIAINSPAGTPVRAVGDGVVIAAAAAPGMIAIRHERQWEDQHVFSTYQHTSSPAVTVGQRVRAGDVIARVGSTGSAHREQVQLQLHVAPLQDSSLIMQPSQGFPSRAVNPQLWLESMPGTGIVAGRVLDSAGQPVRGARVYGLVLPYPEETPFTFAETYADGVRATPSYGEHFAVGDVPAGPYMLGVKIGDRRVWRRIRVTAGMLTWVEFRP